MCDGGSWSLIPTGPGTPPLLPSPLCPHLNLPEMRWVSLVLHLSLKDTHWTRPACLLPVNLGVWPQSDFVQCQLISGGQGLSEEGVC